MDSQQFDRWTQQFGTALSRRRLGAVLAALGLSASLGVGAEAKNKKKKKKKAACDRKQKQKCRQQDRVCEKGKCVIVCNAGNSVCRGNGVAQLCGSAQEWCDCSPLAEGGFACAAALPDTCPGASECASDTECAAGEVCVDASGDDCCGSAGFGLCLTRCKGGNPGN